MAKYSGKQRDRVVDLCVNTNTAPLTSYCIR